MIEFSAWPLEFGINLFRITLVLVFLYILLPRVIFVPSKSFGQITPVSGALWMLFGATVLAHLLITFRLYEAVVVLVLVGLAVLLFWRRTLSSGSMEQIYSNVVSWLLDLVDGRAAPLWGRKSQLGVATTPVQGADRKWIWVSLVLLAVVLVAGAWVRFAPAWSTAALPWSDAPVHLVWVKYLEGGALYADEVYPRGLHIFSSLVRKFSALSVIEVHQVLGPLLGSLIMISVTYFAYKTNGSILAAAVTALLYGSVTSTVPWAPDWILGRQAGLNAHEFGLIFVLPSAWYAFTYLMDGIPADRATAAAAVGIAAFAHPFPLLFSVLSMGAVSAAALLIQGKRSWSRLSLLVGWSVMAVGITFLPLLFALALGERWHGSSVAYLQRVVDIQLQPIMPGFVLAVVLAAALLLLSVMGARHRKVHGMWAGRAALSAVIIVSFIPYFLPHAGLLSKPLLERGQDLPTMGIALSGGLAWAFFETALRRLRLLHVVLAVVLVASAWYVRPPSGAVPNHYVYTNEQTRQVMWADRNLVAGTWTLVMPHTGYGLALRRGFHMEIDPFLAMMEQLPADPVKWPAAAESLGYGLTEHYLLLVEKRVATPTQAEIAPRLEAASRLQQWIDEQKDSLPLTQILDGADLATWHLELDLRPDPMEFYRSGQESSPPAGR